jgi:hypothetical protein
MQVMGTEKSANEILTEFAAKTNREIVVSQQDYPKTTIRPRNFYKKQIIIKDKDEQQICFVWFQDSKAFDKDAMFSGLFFPVQLPEIYEVEIRKKDILDKANPFAQKSSFKSRIIRFSRQTFFEDNDPKITEKIFNNMEIQKMVLQALSINGMMRVGINTIKPKEIEAFENQAVFGIYTRDNWIFEENIIEVLFDLGRGLKGEIEKLERFL